MTNVPVKRGEAARQQPQVATTDADREAGMALDVLHHELIEGGDFHCANRVCVEAIARARAEGAASERAACELALALVERPKKFRADPIRRDTFDDTVAACMAAIRARGERFPLSGADAPSEGGKA